jgi:soluble lytic murein transglycosylase-like protein
MRRRWITRYKKNQKGAYSLLIGLSFIILLIHTKLGPSSQQFQPINRADLHKIISMHHTNPKLVKAIIEVESEWNVRAVSSKGAIGLMQVMPNSGKLYAGFSRSELFCPEKNIIAGTKILKYYQRTSPNLRVALDKYSGGADGYYEKVKRRM